MRLSDLAGAALALLPAGCGDSNAALSLPTAPPAATAPKKLPEPCDELVRVTSGSGALEPGEEVYASWVERSPAAGFVTRITPFADHGVTSVHHLFLTRGAATPEQPVRPVLFAGGRGSLGVELPAGVGLRLQAGEELQLGLHLINPSDRAVSFEAGVELCVRDAVGIEADVVSFGPENISIPPDRAEHTFAASCPIHGERSFFAAWPHMHAMGTRIEIALDGEPLVTVPRWDAGEQPLYPIEPAHTAQATDLSVSCTFVNRGATPVEWGHYARDEMCLAFVYYFPAGLASGWGCGQG